MLGKHVRVFYCLLEIRNLLQDFKTYYCGQNVEKVWLCIVSVSNDQLESSPARFTKVCYHNGTSSAYSDCDLVGVKYLRIGQFLTIDSEGFVQANGGESEKHFEGDKTFMFVEVDPAKPDWSRLFAKTAGNKINLYVKNNHKMFSNCSFQQIFGIVWLIA